MTTSEVSNVVLTKATVQSDSAVGLRLLELNYKRC